MQHLVKASPVLASLNIQRTVSFYKEKLGFTRVGYQDEHYAVLGRDVIEIHFWKCKDKKIPKNTSCYVYVKDIDTLYTELQAQKVIHPNGLLGDRPYGMREFAILDIDGNLIKFGQDL
jgi:catechol 2,3-dioxygenase-like lactoylglutathione lyase family enzyme